MQFIQKETLPGLAVFLTAISLYRWSIPLTSSHSLRALAERLMLVALACLATPSAATFPKSGAWVHHATFLIGTFPKRFGAGRCFYFFPPPIPFPHRAKGAYFTAYSLKMGLAGRKWLKREKNERNRVSNWLHENLCNQQLVFLFCRSARSERLRPAFVCVRLKKVCMSLCARS